MYDMIHKLILLCLCESAVHQRDVSFSVLHAHNSCKEIAAADLFNSLISKLISVTGFPLGWRIWEFCRLLGKILLLCVKYVTE